LLIVLTGALNIIVFVTGNVVESTIVSSRNISSSLVPLKQHLDKNLMDSATTKFSKSYPQPVFESHPNLLKKGEVHK
jgi:hypothetical protein